MNEDRFYKNLIVPLIIYLGVFLIYPFTYAVFTSFNTPGGVGLENYLRLLKEPLFLSAARNNILIPLISVTIEIILGLGLALAVHRINRFVWLFVSLIMAPFVLPEIVFLTASRFILAEHGYLNGLISYFGLRQVYWLRPGSFLSTLLVSVIDAWRLTPLVFLIIYAALKNIPQVIEEQAKIDGATEWQLITYIILPMLAPAIAVALILRSVDGLRIFATPLVLTGVEGVPVISSFAYHQWADYSAAPMACASSSILALIVLFGSLFYARLWHRSEGI